MWVFSRAGFFSAVQKGTEKHAEVCVRARVLEDFDKLRELYFPEMGRVQTTGGTDYPYRIYVSHNEWARIMDNMARDVDYKNFKGMISGERGYAVADLYSDVWAVMYGAEKKVVPQRPPIPVDYSERNAPPFEEWRIEKGVEARDRAAKTNARLEAKEQAAARFTVVSNLDRTTDPIEVFQKRYEAAQQKIKDKRKTSKQKPAKTTQEARASVRGSNGRFATKS